MNHRPTVLITGASHGIGRACAQAFASSGAYDLVLNCKSSGTELEDYCRELSNQYKIRITPSIFDVASSKEVTNAMKRLENDSFKIDILIHNAGISHVGLLTDMTDEEWDRILQTNLSSCFYLSRAVLPHMIHNKEGRILNVSSVWGIHGASCEVAYSASKGGVNSFTKALAKELAPSGISVNAIAFGCIDTRMNGHLDSEEKEELAGEIPAGRFASPSEAGEFIKTIVESKAYLTGQIISFDGGWC